MHRRGGMQDQRRLIVNIRHCAPMCNSTMHNNASHFRYLGYAIYCAMCMSMAKDARLDMRVEGSLKEALLRFAEKDRRRLTDYVEIVLIDHVAEREKREGKRK